MRRKQLVFGVCVALAAALITAAVIYKTPLHYLTIGQPPIRDVDASTVYKEISEHPEQYMFIDVRTWVQYTASHAVGSVNIPIHDLYTKKELLPKDKTIVLICGDGELAGVAYGYLAYYGFNNMQRIVGGLNEWKEHGLPVQTNQAN